MYYLLQKNPVGKIGIHLINKPNKSTSIGYWLSQDYQGKGIMTKACQAVIDYCFSELDINRIEIRCAVGNKKSNKIPLKLFCTKEGTMRQNELVNGVFLDLNVYSILKEEWIRNKYNEEK